MVYPDDLVLDDLDLIALPASQGPIYRPLKQVKQGRRGKQGEAGLTWAFV